jgi:hypothetical protein
MHEQIIEASECLKNWWDRGLIVQQPYTPEDNGSDDCQVDKDQPSCLADRGRQIKSSAYDHGVRLPTHLQV